MLFKDSHKYLDLVGKVMIGKPKSWLFKKKGLEGYDMHSHTHFSDGASSVKGMLRLAKLRHVGFSITDHNEIKGSMIATKQNKVKVIPGIELNSKNGRDMLFYFYSRKDLFEFYQKFVKEHKISPYSVLDYSTLKWSEEELIDFGKQYNAVMAIPHPFGYPIRNNYSFYEKSSKFKDIHAIEVLNGTDIPERNRAAFYWAKNSGKAYIGGSDTHTKLGIGRVLTVGYASEGIADFLDSVKKRKCGVVGKELPFRARWDAGKIVVKSLLFRKEGKE